jgi:hypothetical protein
MDNIKKLLGISSNNTSSTTSSEAGEASESSIDTKEEELLIERVSRIVGISNKERMGPCYENFTQIVEHWSIAMPSGSVVYTGQHDLLLMLKTLELQPERMSPVEQLQNHFNAIHKAVSERPHYVKMDLLYTYILMLKRLGSLFENSNAPFSTSFSSTVTKSSPQFSYGYMNALLVTLARLQDSVRKSGPCRGSIDEITMCGAILKELRICVEAYQKEGLVRSRWFYTASPIAISSKDVGKLDSNKLLEKERQKVLSHITSDVHGDCNNSIQARIALYTLKTHEVVVKMLVEKSTSLSNQNRSISSYNHIAPLMKYITIKYSEVARMCGGGEEDPLYLYTRYYSYWWYLQMEFMLAKSDWSMFGEENCLEFTTYGKRSLKRLFTLLSSLKSKQAWLEDLPLSIEVRNGLHTLRGEVKILFTTVKDRIYDVLDYNEDMVDIPDITSYQEVVSSTDDNKLEEMVHKKWVDYCREDGGDLADAFKILRDSLAVVPTKKAPTGAYGTATTTSDTDIQQAVMKERKTHLDWLVSMIDENGEIHIGKGGCIFLKNQLDLCK